MLICYQQISKKTLNKSRISYVYKQLKININTSQISLGIENVNNVLSINNEMFCFSMINNFLITTKQQTFFEDTS